VSRREAPPGGPSAPVARTDAEAPATAPAGVAAAPGSPTDDAAPARRPRSLRGTTIDGALPVDAGGHLVVAPDVRRFFDYFLALTGEESLPRIHDRLVHAIGARLHAPADREAEELLDRYLAYRDRARDLTADGTVVERLEAVRALRRETLGVTTAAQLFSDEDARDDATVLAHATAEDPSLTPEERTARLSALEAALPDDVRAATLPLRLGQEEAALAASGASPTEVHALREQMVGPEATARLEALDRERAEWQRRFDAYRAERVAIEANAGRTPEERTAAIAQLRDERFTPEERRRVEALDRADAFGLQAAGR
jgi:lipase chaperone LimK